MPSSEEMFDEYVRTSAAYCADLFRTAELFFRANVALESTIIDENTSHCGTVEEICKIFIHCREITSSTITSLATFKRCHTALPEQLDIDFSYQEQLLASIVDSLNRIVNLFDSVSDFENLQNQIWDDDNFTNAFTKTAQSISHAILWQCSFARKANLDELS
jgi:hypothetical protein